MCRPRYRHLIALLAFGVLSALALPGIGASPAFALPPTLSVPGGQTVAELQNLAFVVTATDPEGQICDLYASNMPGGASFMDNRNNTGSFDWTPDNASAGSYLVYFLADDTFGGTATRTVSIDVTDANGAPVLDPIADRTMDPGSMAFLSVYGWDPDQDPLTLSAAGLPSFGTLYDNGDGTGTIVLMPSASQPGGSWPVTVELSDGTTTVSQGFTVTVTGSSVQHPPVLETVPNQTVAEGSTSTAVLSATDVDGDALTWTAALPGFASLAPGSGGAGAASATLTMSPGYCAAGTYSATVRVNDGALYDEQTFSIVVTDVPRSPSWNSGAYAVTVAEGATATLNVSASDPDGVCGAPAPTLSLVGSTAGQALSLSFVDNRNGAGTLSVTAGSSSEGSYTVTLRATDSASSALVVEVSIPVTVTNTNHVPVAEAGGPYYGATGVSLQLNGSGSSDPDADPLTYTWVFGDGSTGTGATVSHVYAAAGSYAAMLTVSDGTLGDVDVASVKVESSGRPADARVWNEPQVIRLQRGVACERVYLEPVGGSFSVEAVVASSVTLTTETAAGRVAAVVPAEDRSFLVGDHDGNGVTDLELGFRTADLAALCSFVEQPMLVTFTLSAALLTGAELQVSFTAEVVPGRKGTIHRIGPNPLNPETVVTLEVKQSGPVRLSVYDLGGRLRRTVYEGEGTAGQTLNIRFDGRDGAGKALASGRYFLRAEMGGVVETGSLTILK